MNSSQKIAQMIDLPPAVILAEREKFENWYIQTFKTKEEYKAHFFEPFGNYDKSNVLYYVNDFFDKLFCAWLMGVQLSGSVEKNHEISRTT